MTKTDQDLFTPNPDEKAWEDLAKNLVRAEMMKRGVSFAQLPELLEQHGVFDNEANLRNKVGRGRFSFIFFLQCMMALGVDWMQIPSAIADGTGKHAAQKLARKLSGPAAEQVR